MTLKITTVSDFVSFVQAVDEIRGGDTDTEFWFRGCGRSSHPLLPSLYRHPTKKEVADLHKLELELITAFKQRSIPYLQGNGTFDADDWSTLFLMQHYGVPTRLLDWSQNPFIALYFALSTCPKFSNGLPSSDVALWVLNPIAWNRHALRHTSFDGGVLTPYSEETKAHAPKASGSGNIFPVAIYGAHNSVRIVAQRGAFTIFGRELNPMEKLHVQDKYPEDCLTKILVKKENVHQLLQSVLSNGITESVVFPDLEGLAKELKRKAKF